MLQDGMLPRTNNLAMQIRTGSADSNGMLMLLDDQLIAILVELADEIHGDACGRWALETSFGLFSSFAPETFVSLDQAWDWLLRAADGTQWRVLENTRAQPTGAQ